MMHSCTYKGFFFVFCFLVLFDLRLEEYEHKMRNKNSYNNLVGYGPKKKKKLMSIAKRLNLH